LHEDEDYYIDKPLLLICGEHDNTGNIKKIAKSWASREPKCEFHWIADAGHCANQDNPEAVNKLLLPFLARYSQLGVE
jgi:pimeloyl-ACP methyl ester carboxylesterase